MTQLSFEQITVKGSTFQMEKGLPRYSKVQFLDFDLIELSSELDLTFLT